jgi:hypothetical protein
VCERLTNFISIWCLLSLNTLFQENCLKFPAFCYPNIARLRAAIVRSVQPHTHNRRSITTLKLCIDFQFPHLILRFSSVLKPLMLKELEM